MLHLADGGLQNIVDELRELKSLAINSANDHNTDIDRATLQKEYDNRIANINDIASETNYNGIPLLDGTWRRPAEKIEAYTVIIKGGGSTQPTNPSNPVDPTTSLPVRPTGNVTTISGDYTINTDGVYQLGTNYSGTVTINANNVELRQTDAYDKELAIVTKSGGQTNLWLNNINVIHVDRDGGTPHSYIRFNGDNDTLNLIGDNIFSASYGKIGTQAGVYVAKALTINDGNNGNGSLNSTAYTTGAGIGSDANEQSNAAITINGGNVYGCSESSSSTGISTSTGAGIGSGANASIGSIIIHGGTVNGTCDFANGAGIGSGTKGTVSGDIIIDGGTVFAEAHNVAFPTANGSYMAWNGTIGGGAGLGAGEDGTVTGQIKITGGTVRGDAWGFGAGIGTGGYTSTYQNDGSTIGTSSVGGIIVKNAEVHARSRFAQALGSGTLDTNVPASSNSCIGDVGTLDIDGGTYGTSNDVDGRTYVDYSSTQFAAYDRQEGSSTPTTPTKPDDPNTGKDSDKSETRYRKVYIPGHPLIIHSDTKANQHIEIFINDMHTTSLGLDGVVIDPREEALKALDPLDSALEYALNESTHVGAYSSRLDYTEKNLITAQESTQLSESTVRDADMAKEMVNYVKDNFLSQSSQAMLAQSNQSKSIVLKLIS